MLDLYKLYSLVTDRKGRKYHLFEHYFNFSYKTLQRNEEKLSKVSFNKDYMNEYGELSEEDFHFLNKSISKFFKKATLENIPTKNAFFSKEIRQIHPDFYLHFTMLASSKQAVENCNDEQLFSFFIKGYNFSIDCIKTLSKMRFAMAKQKYDDYCKLAQELKFPFDFHFQKFRNYKDFKESTECATFEKNFELFLIIYADILLFSSQVLPTEQLGNSRILYWLQKSIEENKTAREICFINLQKNTFKSTKYEELVQEERICSIGSNMSFYDFLQSYAQEKEVETLERYCKQFRSSKKLQNKGLEYILQLYLLAVEGHIDTEYMATVKSEFALACIADEMSRGYNQNNQLYHDLSNFQQWILDNIYNNN